jgi:hypothetical protein
MNRKALWIVLLALGATAGCGSSNNNGILVSISQAPPGIITPGGTAQITATVTGDSKNAGVTWSCTPGNTASTCGSFTPMATASGTPTMYQAPSSPVGSVTITATSVTNTAAFGTANVNISTSGGLAGNYAFYLSGLDFNFNSYSLAGAVTIAADGTLTGEQDFNNTTGDNSPAVGDKIMTGSSLSFDATTGLGMLNLQTNNKNLGTNGTETLELNFVNNSHALIIQADGFATSSGSFDLQNFSSPLANEGFSFVLSGAHDASGETFIYGGVFTLSGGTSITNGTMDSNDGHGTIALGHSFGGTLMATDTFGRGTGTLSNTVGGLSSSIAFYVVGPEVIRIIDKDSADTAVGSAFGQGSGAFTNSSLVTSILSVQSNSAGFPFTAVGQIVPSGGDAVQAGAIQSEQVATNDFSGIADVNETPDSGLNPFFLDAATISGTYFIQSNGYGGLTIGSANNDQLLDVADLGIYIVNPNININDPNNSSGGGGALVADLDVNLAGSGVLVPQTPNLLATSFAGNYAFGLQDFVPNAGEFDIVGNATATTSLTGFGVVSDPTDVLGGSSAVESGTFSSPITPDTTNNAGRFLMDSFTVDVADGTSTIDYGAVLYQASGGQLFWMENGGDAINAETSGSVFSGQIQQQTLPLGAAAKKAAVKQTQKQ